MRGGSDKTFLARDANTVFTFAAITGSNTRHRTWPLPNTGRRQLPIHHPSHPLPSTEGGGFCARPDR